MSYRYWDSGTTPGNYWDTSNSSTVNLSWHYFPRPQLILITEPEHWTDEDGLAFVQLVNKKTRTGITIKLRIKGDVLITDAIETRTMAEFVPLLRRYAFGSDLAKISMFFEDHPCKPLSG